MCLHLQISLQFQNGSIATIVYNIIGSSSFPKERIEVFGGSKVGIIDDFKKLPKELISLKVNDPQRVIMDSRIRSEVSKLENKLGKEGRVLLRPSGTEDLIRVMVEANSETLAKDLASELAQFIQQAA